MTNKDRKINEAAEQVIRERIAELEAMEARGATELGTRKRIELLRNLLSAIRNRAA